MVRDALGTVFDALEEPLLVLGSSWQVEYVNDAMRRWMVRAGVEVEPLPRALGDLALGLGSGVKDMVAAVMAGGQSQSRIEVVQIGPRLLWLHTQVLPLQERSLTAMAVVQLRDVTNTTRVEQMLRAKDAVLDASPVALGFADSEGRLAYANAALQRLLGFANRSESVGKRFDELWQVPDLVHKVLAVVARGESWDGELVARRADGSMFAAHLAARPTLTGGSQSGVMVFAVSDLTERVRIEDALGESEATTRILLNANPDPVYLLTAEGDVLSANPAVLQILGRPAEEILGRPLHHSLQDEGGVDARLALALARETGKPVRYEDSIEGRDFDNWVVPIGDGLGGVARLALFSRDITGRKAVEAALTATNQVLSALIEASPLPIVALTPQQRVTLWSRAAERLFGWTEEEAAGRTHPAVPENEINAYRAMLAAAIRGEATGGIEVSRARRDGTAIDALVYLAPLFDAAGQVAGAMEIAEDITERKRLQGHLLEMS